MFSKKATKIYLTLTTECQIDGVDFVNLAFLDNMNFTTYDKSTVEISQNFVAFSKYMYSTENKQKLSFFLTHPLCLQVLT